MKIRECEVKWMMWPIKPWVAGITLYPFIFYKGEPPLYRRRHEYIHIRQVRDTGWFKFYAQYVWYGITRGYRGIPFEIEAYEKQDLPGKPWVEYESGYYMGVWDLIKGVLKGV